MDRRHVLFGYFRIDQRAAAGGVIQQNSIDLAAVSVRFLRKRFPPVVIIIARDQIAQILEQRPLQHLFRGVIREEFEKILFIGPHQHSVDIRLKFFGTRFRIGANVADPFHGTAIADAENQKAAGGIFGTLPLFAIVPAVGTGDPVHFKCLICSMATGQDVADHIQLVCTVAALRKSPAHIFPFPGCTAVSFPEHLGGNVFRIGLDMPGGCLRIRGHALRTILQNKDAADQEDG